MTMIDENHLHADPGIEARGLHHDAPVGGDGATPMQREVAQTIFEKGAAGRRAFTCLRAGVPERDRDELLPARLRPVWLCPGPSLGKSPLPPLAGRPRWPIR